jgi:hypothetical protein
MSILATMTSYSPEALGDIQARLAHLRLRKAALDNLIISLEQYSEFESAPPRKMEPAPESPRLAGVA